MSITDNSLMGFCIYQYINSGSSDFRGYIEDQVSVVDNNKETTICNVARLSEGVIKKFIFIGHFYALSPTFRPIPYNMKMVAIEYTDFEPIIITNVYYNNDIFNYKDNTIYFITYNLKLPNTIPVYFYSYGKSIIPTLENKAPTNDPNWKVWKIPVIYVLPTNVNKFSCYEGNIIFDEKSNKTFYENLMLCKSETFFDGIEKIKKSQRSNRLIFSNIQLCNFERFFKISLTLIVVVYLIIIIITGIKMVETS